MAVKEAADAPLRIKVNPIDRTKPGSRGQRRRLLEFLSRAQTAAGATPEAMLALMAERDAIVLAHCETVDGGDVQAALDDLSEEHYDALLNAIAGGAVEAAVPTSSGDSPNGSPKA